MESRLPRSNHATSIVANVVAAILNVAVISLSGVTSVPIKTLYQLSGTASLVPSLHLAIRHDCRYAPSIFRWSIVQNFLGTVFGTIAIYLSRNSRVGMTTLAVFNVFSCILVLVFHVRAYRYDGGANATNRNGDVYSRL